MIWENFFKTRLYEEKSEDDGTSGDDGNDENQSDDESNNDEQSDDKDDKKDDEEELSEEEIKENKALYKLLKDPHTRDLTIKALAEKAGLFKESQTKSEEKKATKTILSVFEKKLGDKYSFLAPNLAEAIEEILGDFREENKTKISELEETQLKAEVNTAFEKLARDTKGNSRKYEKAMISLADKIKPAAGLNTYEYLENLYMIASAKGQKQNTTREMVEKINRNAKDAGSRLQSSSSSNGKNREVQPKTIRGATEAALKELMEK